MSADRTFIASEITRRMNYIRHDSLELARLLQGETLSEGFHEDLVKIATDLFEIAKKARPRVPMREDEAA